MIRSRKARDARDPEREFTKNTRNVLFSTFTSSSFVVVVVFDDDDETVADGEMRSAIVSLFFLSEVPLRCARALKRAQKHRGQREKKKRETALSRRQNVLGFSRVSVSTRVLL